MDNLFIAGNDNSVLGIFDFNTDKEKLFPDSSNNTYSYTIPTTHQIYSAANADTFAHITPNQYLIQEVLPNAQLALQQFLVSPDFSNNIELAFGYGCNLELAHSLVENLAAGQIVPNIQIIPQSQLNADGAFGNNTIYISQDLLNPHEANPSQAVNVLLEEIGHYIDDKINILDAPGDEGAVFAYLVQNRQLTATELTALKIEDDLGTLNINGENVAVEHADTPGIFLVENTGQISINFLADSGSYRSEMAVFSLEGIENLTPGSVDYIKEAARRALSNSKLGYVVIIDPNEGAKFTGELGESNKNDGNYTGVKTFNFTPGDKIAMMLVPQGTVKQVFDNPNVGNNQRPLFSIIQANPNNATQMGQLVTGTFGWEDIRVDQGTDADYNDIIFQIQGATGTAPNLGRLFASGKDWRNLPLAQEIIAFAITDLTANLSQDTGISNLDGITNNGEIVGSLTNVSNISNISKLQARFSDSSNYVDILSELKSDGTFTLNKDKLTQIKGSQLADGEYQLNLRSEDTFGNVAEFSVKFILDTTKPGTPTEIGIKDDSDTVTNNNTPTIKGKGETGALIELFDGENKLGKTTVVNGFWEITTTQLTDGLKNLTVTATDIASNKSDAGTKEFTIDSAIPQLNITSPQANAVLSQGARLQGTVNDTGSTIDKLSYRFDNGSEINVPVNAQGAFDVELNLAGLSGEQNLIIKAIDLAGNSTETTQIVVVNLDNTAPSITAALNHDTGNNTDGITSDSTITGTVSDASEITTFQAKLNSGNFVDVLAKLQNGNFTLDKDTITQINGGQLPDGTYQLTLKAEDEFGNVSSEVTLDFNLDTTAPQAANFISSVIVSELQNPRGMAIDNAGNLYFTEAGSGGNGTSVVGGSGATVFYGETGRISIYNPNTKTITPLITNLPSLATSTGEEGTGIADLAFNSAGDLYGVIGLGTNPEARTTLGVSDFGQVIAINLSGTPSWTTVADIAAFEAENNPDPGDVNSNPYSLAIHDGTIFVSDAAGNDVFKVNGSTVSLETVLASRLVTAPPFIPSPTIPMQAVPTGIAIGADNVPYLGQLTGFPFPSGEANVYSLAEGDATIFAEGFSYITDIAFGADNSLYVLEYGKDFLGGDFQGSLWEVKADGTRSKIVSGGLLTPTGLAVDDERIYIANRGNIAEQGEILELLNLNTFQGNAQLSAGARLQGNVNGTGSTIDKLSYRFDNGSEINVPVNADGSFDVELNLAGLSGEQNLIIKAIDLAGNTTTTNLNVEVLASNMPSFK